MSDLSFALEQIEACYKRTMSALELGPIRLILGKDGTFHPDNDHEATREKAARAKTLFDNFRALVDGPDSHFWYTQVPHGQRLYLAGKAKPSRASRSFGHTRVIGVSAGGNIPFGTMLSIDANGRVVPTSNR